MSRRLLSVAEREQQLTKLTALISSGGHTFVVQRLAVSDDVGPSIKYAVTVPDEEGELRLVRCGPHNDGPYGLVFLMHGSMALPIDRALWWMHAIHAAARLAEQLNRRAAA